jgi:hypothetical protein
MLFLSSVKRLRKVKGEGNTNKLLNTTLAIFLVRSPGLIPKWVQIPGIRTLAEGELREVHKYFFFPHGALKKEACAGEIEHASLDKLAKLIKVFRFLLQTKVHLLWWSSQEWSRLHIVTNDTF